MILTGTEHINEHQYKNTRCKHAGVSKKANLTSVVPCYWHRLPPVFHQSDLPLASDLFIVLWWGALHGAWGRSHHDALSQARVGRTQLVGGYVSCGSYGGKIDKSIESQSPATVLTFCCPHSSFIMKTGSMKGNDSIFLQIPPVFINHLFNHTVCSFTFPPPLTKQQTCMYFTRGCYTATSAKTAYLLSFLP